MEIFVLKDFNEPNNFCPYTITIPFGNAIDVSESEQLSLKYKLGLKSSKNWSL